MNIYNKDPSSDEWITAICFVVIALMFLAVCLCFGLRGEQRKSPNDLRGEYLTEKYKNLQKS